MLRTNAESLPIMAVQGNIIHPMAFDIVVLSSDADGAGIPCMTMGGITYNYKVGDCCMGILGDHIEASVSTGNEMGGRENLAYIAYASIGNTAKIITGRAKGEVGYVAGKHGSSHVMIQFSDETMEKLTYNDLILIKSHGMGLQLLDYPDIKVMNISPDLLNRMGIREESGKLIVPVAKRIPAGLIGSGVGKNAYTGDYDLETSDKTLITKLGLDDLRFGDIVELTDADNTYQRGYLKGAVSIAVIIHGDSYVMGHGPGIMTLLSSKQALIETELDEKANLVNMIR